jgi:hypothetical protein
MFQQPVLDAPTCRWKAIQSSGHGETMDLHDAIQKAGQILDQERISPTVGYELATTDRTLSVLSVVVGPLTERGTQFRAVQEHADRYQFKSLNFDLLSALFDQVPAQSRQEWLAPLRARFLSTHPYRHTSSEVLGSGKWQRTSSELPLIAEFLVRRGQTILFISTLAEAAPSPGLTLLLIQLAEMIALNFTLFTDEEYTLFPKAIASIRKAIVELGKRPKPISTIESNVIYHVREELPEFCDSVLEACRKARYLYVKGSLLPGMNLEVNQDKTTVRTFLEKLGFPQLLAESLEEAERLYRTTASPFELKSSMGHLRSFLEQLHVQACTAAHKKFGGQVPAKWGEALKYLREHNILTMKEEQFAIQFYALMSDTSVHPLVAEREYARLMRNMSIEYGLLLLTKLDKLGLK